ncbi:phosphoserine phosphatase SerB [uncultured Hyphomonas sp.]|uniref:phosphoserine phosphatase SerB n=1 Tax=uncultured Hyphomonas sp. TaxID=225298 RepID=UPI002AAB4FC9|nr:phosphoserine phosphatase SerB [uncultured Hyphomonas sp.]
MSLRIVAVAAMDAAKLEAEVSQELGRVAPSRSLGSVDGLVALEWQVPGGEDEAARLRARLAEKGHPVDAAVLPAASGRKRLLISDMDSTIIGQECLDELADFAGLKAEVSAITERAMRGELDFEGALTTRVAMLKGLGLDALEHAYAERITLNPGAKTLVETMKADGAETVLVSGGFTYFTSRVAAAAGFHTHRGNTLIDDGKALTGEVGRPILGREAKLSALDEFAAAKGIGRDDVIAMGDGANDLAMIKASGLGIAYHAKPVVAAEAHAAIEHTDLRAALFFQGYEAKEFVG